MSAIDVKNITTPNNFDLTINTVGSGTDIIFKSNGTQTAKIDQAGNLTLTGTVDGVDIQTLNTAVTANTAKVTNSTSASDLTSGTLPMARLSGTLPALNGSALTNLPATDISGKLNLSGGTMTGSLAITTASTVDTVVLTRGTTSHNNMFKFKTGSSDKWIVGQRNDSTDHFRFYSYGTSSDVLSILTDGKVGIGTTSPTYTLDVYNSAIGDVARFNSSSGNRSLNFISSTVGAYVGAVWTRDINSAGGQHVWSNNGSERMRINSSGKVGIGTTSPNYTVEIANVSSKGWSVNVENNSAKMRSRASANDTQTHWDIMNGNGVVGTIKTLNSATQFNTSSDYRLKENVDYTWDATTRLKQLKPARFNFITDDTNTLVDGFIAHEVSSVVPEAISGIKDAVEQWESWETLPNGVSVGDNKLDNDGNTIIDSQGIDQSKLVPLLVKAMQEQQTTIESLTSRITALEA